MRRLVRRLVRQSIRRSLDSSRTYCAGRPRHCRRCVRREISERYASTIDSSVSRVGRTRYHVQYPRFKKESDTKYVADGTESFWKGGCCVGACNNKGDAIELMDDGKIYWHAGDNNAVPPCIGKNAQKVASMKVPGGAPPTNATMER